MNADYLQAMCYLDTNLLIYMFDRNAPAKQRKANELYLHFLRQRTGHISVQVIAEWRNAMVKKFQGLVNGELRRTFIDLLQAWNPLPISPRIIRQADELCEQYHFSPYDSIHVQCALDLNCAYLLSEDMQDGLVVEGRLTLLNPFR